MNKLTIFFVVASVSISLIVGTVLTMKYLNSDDVKADVLKVTSEIPEIIKKTEVLPVLPEPEMPVASLITEEKITQAGFKNALLKAFEFSGIVFDSIDISEFAEETHIKHQIYSENEFAGEINELFFPTSDVTLQVYDTIKLKMEASPDFTLNETNQYGENSFFANHPEDKNSVFLVVKLNTRLYTLHYPAKNHNKIKNLINLF